jgi:Uma2 family endonuclease
MAMPLTHRRFTVDEYHRMAAAGILSEDDRVELLDGEIVEMTPIGGAHVACVIRLNHLLTSRVGAGAAVSVQNPLLLADRSEPQPDVVVLRRQEDLAGAWLPGHEEALLVIEVADVSLERDRNVKIPLYARAGIPEVWLVNLPGDRIEVHREPGGGVYADRQIYGRGATLNAIRLPNLSIHADEILG